MKAIRCPSCGTIQIGKKFCSCGCYLPPLLEEEYTPPVYIPKYYSDNSMVFGVGPYKNQASNLQAQLADAYAQMSNSVQTQYILSQLHRFTCNYPR